MSSAVAADAQLPPAFRSMAARQSQTSSPKKTTMTWAEKRQKQALATQQQQQAKAKAAKQGTSQDRPKNLSDLDFDVDNKKSRRNGQLTF